MRILGTASTILLLLSACRPSLDAQEPASSDPAVIGETGPNGRDGAAPECLPLAPAEVANAAAELGVAKLEEARDGEHYRTGPFEEGMVALRTAAEQGHRGAQSLYGRRLFEVRFMNDAPTPAEQDDYVAAFMYLRIAALRGDPAVQDYLPGLAARTPPVTEEPLRELPAEWLTEAYARADAWMVCHGDAVGDRGTEASAVTEPPG